VVAAVSELIFLLAINYTSVIAPALLMVIVLVVSPSGEVTVKPLPAFVFLKLPVSFMYWYVDPSVIDNLPDESTPIKGTSVLPSAANPVKYKLLFRITLLRKINLGAEVFGSQIKLFPNNAL
jgi:hypothetical protein